MRKSDAGFISVTLFPVTASDRYREYFVCGLVWFAFYEAEIVSKSSSTRDQRAFPVCFYFIACTSISSQYILFIYLMYETFWHYKS